MTVNFVKCEAIRGESSTPVIEVESKMTPMMPSGFGFLCNASLCTKIEESAVRGTKYPNPGGCILSGGMGKTKLTTPTEVAGLYDKLGRLCWLGKRSASTAGESVETTIVVSKVAPEESET